MAENEEPAAPALKEWFNEARFRTMAADVVAVHPKFDAKAFLAATLPGLEPLNLMQRLRRMTEGLHATLPSDYEKTLGILRNVAPRIDHNFVTLVLPDYVSQYGLEHFEPSMEALKFFTPFGSAEFAIRPFLRQDLKRTLKVMHGWSRDKDEHVRRLASEGCRPRLPWSFRLDALIKDPSPVLPILSNLKADPSLYVRKSVANHLNDITKDHPDWVLDLLAEWPMEHEHTAWIAKRALRTLIKKGDKRALAVIGAGEKAEVKVVEFSLSPQKVKLGERLTMSLHLQSKAKKAQRLVIDYAIHYVKKSGATSAKVFKWKECTLEPGAVLTLAKTQRFVDFTTRDHHPGKHLVDVMVNGEVMGSGEFVLVR
ncbi:3-methyladenine DNA glycosylase AlkC [Roseimicrobium gellanilyticum]|uniref:3-methyladenine DNA glycosylase AlkC n=1 Tax=Roseimicrobium gellanilyticum TaxID=748857 RepID=A0A366HDH2_9BACT|nr:DNA alkylation repair protein [Roseimicrobium gellanilyticum]RBP40501.1 3-methyladenine DNA glycosylase AlkC [Roseimicrobium gellanilyticum]